MKRLTVISLHIVFVAFVASAQIPGQIGVFADPAGTDCNIVDNGSLVQVHFVHFSHSGATASQFKLDVSPVGWIHLGDSWNLPTVIGTSINGVSLGYGACMAAPTYLGMANFFGSAAPPCSQIWVVPDPASPSGSIQVVDCAFNLLLAPNSAGVVNCGPCGVKPPENLLPSDGAIAIGLNPTVSWTWEQPTGCPEGLGYTQFTVYLGTDPNNLTEAGWVLTDTQVAVGPLLAGTTYFWQVEVNDGFWECPGSRVAYSEVQSFMTEGVIPTDQSTWGKIKSLYR
jgi:hypothetical protein